ncbi:ead/Ea22-like family protein [Escherichia coli]|uniref:ead/Ea22-like family protein n=1 Tax=Escherichia coli TaxID=562 RepID=UPI0037C0B4CE
MSEINYQALREVAEKAGEDRWQAKKINGDFFVIRHGSYTRQHGYTSYQPIAEIDCKPVRDFVAKANPATVLALLDERERNQQYIKRRDQENEDIALTVGKLRVELEAVQKTSAARIEAIDRTHKMFQREKDRADAAEKCIAELSASHSKLRDTMAGIHNTIRMDGGYTPLAAILNAAKRAYEESASAAGIRIKGE